MTFEKNINNSRKSVDIKLQMQSCIEMRAHTISNWLSSVGVWGGGVHLVKHLEELGTGLVDGADDSPPSESQGVQQRDHLVAGGAV